MSWKHFLQPHVCCNSVHVFIATGVLSSVGFIPTFDVSYSNEHGVAKGVSNLLACTVSLYIMNVYSRSIIIRVTVISILSIMMIIIIIIIISSSSSSSSSSAYH